MKLRITLLILVLTLTISTLFAQDVTLSAGKPAEAGMDEGILMEGVRLYKESVQRDELKGVALLVARWGVVVLHEAIGMRNVEKGLPMVKNTTT